jgi:hypothetical protein
LVRTPGGEHEFPPRPVRGVPHLLRLVSLRGEFASTSARSRKGRVDTDVSICPSAANT